jgi:4-amino-4-deoxy-L-arabinose transferase-like glycosyltransferase
MTITTHIYTTIPGFFLWGRLLTVALGGLTVAGVYALGRRVWGAGAGLIGALFLAISQFHLQHSQYVTTDVASGLFVLLAFLFAFAVARQGHWRDYLLAGLLAGMAASTKYNVGVVALPIAAAHLLRWGRHSLVRGPRLLGAAATAVLGFVLGTPYALLSWPEFWKGLTGQVAAYNDGSQGDIRGAWNLRGYFDFFWDTGLLAPGCIAALLGLGLLWRAGPRKPGARAAALLWLSFALPYLLLLLSQSTHFLRNFIPLFVLCMLPIGVAGAGAIEWIGQRAQSGRLLECRAIITAKDACSLAKVREPTSFLSPSRDWMRLEYLIRTLGSMAVLIVLLFPSAAQTLAYAQRLGRGDTRVQMLGWLAAHVPPGARIAAELKPLPGPLESPWVAVDALPDHDLAWYRRQGYAFLIGSSDQWRRWDVPEEYQRLAGAPPAAEFGGTTPRDMFGPHLVIYTTGLAAGDVPGRLASDVRIGGARLLGSAIGAQESGVAGATPALKAGDTLSLRTFWQVDQPFTADYFIFVHVLNAAGQTVAQRDAPPWQGRFPTSSWRAGTRIVDVNDLPLPADLPTGEYTLVVGMFDPATGAHPPTQVDGRQISSSETQIGKIRVEH